jgi:hypothetical protein
MKKTYAALSACLLVGLLLAGCSSNNSSNGAGPSSSAAPSASTPSAPSASASASAAQPSSSSSPSASASPAESAMPQEKAVAPEKNPVGDIPDSQQFVKYSSKAGGYSLEVPEGWARTESGSDVNFISKLDGVKVSVTAANQAPTADSVKADLVKNGRAVKINSVKAVKLHNGKAIKASFSSNSEPNSVTGKQVRQENEVFYFVKDKKIVVLTMWAPLGADNVDQWNKMSDSFGWNAK